MHARYKKQGKAAEQSPVCNVSFPTRSRALHHAEYSSKRCRAVFESGAIPPLTPEQRAELDSSEAAFRKAHIIAGTSYLAGG